MNSKLTLQRVTNPRQCALWMHQARQQEPEMLDAYLSTARFTYQKELQILKPEERNAGTFLYAVMSMCREMANRIRGEPLHQGIKMLPFKLAKCRPIGYAKDWTEEVKEYRRFQCRCNVCVWCWYRLQTQMLALLPKKGLMAHHRFWAGLFKPPHNVLRVTDRKLRAQGYELVMRVHRPQIAPKGVTVFWITHAKEGKQDMSVMYTVQTFALLQLMYPFQWRLAKADGSTLLDFSENTAGLSRYCLFKRGGVAPEVDRRTDMFLKATRNNRHMFKLGGGLCI